MRRLAARVLFDQDTSAERPFTGWRGRGSPLPAAPLDPLPVQDDTGREPAMKNVDLAATDAEPSLRNGGQRTTLSRYFADLSRHPLLKKRGEVACGRRMTAGKLVVFEALAVCPALYRAFRGWRAELCSGASPYRFRRIPDGGDLEFEATEPVENGDGTEEPNAALSGLFDCHRKEAIAAIAEVLACESLAKASEISGRSAAGKAIAAYGLLAWQYKTLIDALLTDVRTLAAIDIEAAKVARAVGRDTSEFTALWLSYSPLWGNERGRCGEPALLIDGDVEFASVLSKLADFTQRISMSLPAFRRALLLARCAIAAVEEAKQDMANANMRLVVMLARQWQHRGVRLEDLVQEGNIGLLRAVDGFDHTLGYKFSTYASWWIKQSLMRAVADQGRTIRYPVHLVENISKVAVAKVVFQQRHGRLPTDDEILQTTGLRPAALKRVLRAVTTVSLDMPIGEDQDAVLADRIEDTGTPRPDAGLLQGDIKRQLDQALATLPKWEAEILRQHFGIGQDERTFDDIGQRMSLSRERIRQLEIKALARLKRQPLSHMLRPLLS